MIGSQHALTQNMCKASKTPIQIKVMFISHPNARYHKPALLPAVFFPFSSHAQHS